MSRNSSDRVLINTSYHVCAVGQVLPEGILSSYMYVRNIAWVYGSLHQSPDLCAIELLCRYEVQQALDAR